MTGNKPKVYVILEGGGVKGCGLVGALEVVAEKATILGVGGSSAGAIVAALYAAGYDCAMIKKIMFDAPLPDFRDGGSWLPDKLTLWRRGYLYEGSVFQTWIKQQLVDAPCHKDNDKSVPVEFKDLQYPLKIVAANLTDQNMETFDATNNKTLRVDEAVRMSMSIPIFYKPYLWGQKVMVDGGTVSNFPLWLFKNELAREKGSSLIGIRLKQREKLLDPPSGKLSDILTRLAQTAMASQFQIVSELMAVFQIITVDVGDVQTTDFDISKDKKTDLHRAGQTAAETYFLRQENKALKAAELKGFMNNLGSLMDLKGEALEKFTKGAFEAMEGSR